MLNKTKYLNKKILIKLFKNNQNITKNMFLQYMEVIQYERKQIAKEFAETIKSDKIKQIILFGSVARGDDTPDSDIDILIVSDNKKEIEPLINDTAFQIILEKQEVISPHIASESKLDPIKDYSFMKNIRRDGIDISQY